LHFFSAAQMVLTPSAWELAGGKDGVELAIANALQACGAVVCPDTAFVVEEGPSPDTLVVGVGHLYSVWISKQRFDGHIVDTARAWFLAEHAAHPTAILTCSVRLVESSSDADVVFVDVRIR
jgi:hypothetical protein